MHTIEIFRAGTHTAVNGRTIEFSAADLAGTAAAYDRARHEAPIVVGHPAMDAPAYGWVKRVTVNGDSLAVEPTQVDPAFAELVAKGRYKKVSAAFYPPEHPANPHPGAWSLKHVGFLGAVPPSVKGLRQVQFGEIDGALEFADWSQLTVAGLFSRLRDWMIGQYGQDKADAALPPDAIDSLKFDAAQPDPPADATDTPSYTEPTMTTPTPAELALAAAQAEFAQQQAAFAQQQAAFAESQAAARRQAHQIYVAGLVKAGKFPSGEAAGLVAFMECLPAGADDVIAFAEPGGKTAKIEPSTWFMGLLSRLPNLVHFGEVASARDTVSFAESEGAITALSRKYIAEQAALGRQVSPAEAVQHVMGARP